MVISIVELPEQSPEAIKMRVYFRGNTVESIFYVFRRRVEITKFLIKTNFSYIGKNAYF